MTAAPHQVPLDSNALRQALQAQGESWYQRVRLQCPHLFAGVEVVISTDRLQQMHDVIGAIERVVRSNNNKGGTAHFTRGVFYGYDFHLNDDGVHLIEINTNAGGAFLNALLIESQQASQIDINFEQVFIAMFRNEWRLAGCVEPLRCIAIVDEQPEQQYLYPEFLLAQGMFERAGIQVLIADPTNIQAHDGHLYIGESRVDLVYNRLTDFSLQRYPVLSHAWQRGEAVFTPAPDHYAMYADKRNLARLTDAEELRKSGVDEADIAILQAGIPATFVVRPDSAESLWSERKGLFFKPCAGYGSKGAYRGDKLTRRVFGEILQSDYVAQKLAVPGECRVDDDTVLKYDLRCYVYDGEIQLLAARLYQGQTTNFRTPGGGFALVRVVG